MSGRRKYFEAIAKLSLFVVGRRQNDEMRLACGAVVGNQEAFLERPR